MILASQTRRELSETIRAGARRLGFDLVGIAPAVTPQGFDRFQEWLARGFAGQMAYMENHAGARQHPQHVLDGVRSVIMVAMNYHTADPAQGLGSAEFSIGSVGDPPLMGQVSRYAWGKDYHLVLRARLEQLQTYVAELVPGSHSRVVVDTAPLLERDFAGLAGLGWIGKNTMLIHKKLGSWLFLGALLVDVVLDDDAPHEASHCGTCTRCLDACPTGAFAGPYQLDSRRCISYLTIELRAPIPEALREGMGTWVFGCDVCQDVCPWNHKAPRAQEAAFAAQPAQRLVDLTGLLAMNEAQFRAAFRETALLRPKRAGILRNAAMALGNLGDPRAVPALTKALSDVEPLVRGAAAWALGKIATAAARAALEQRYPEESDAPVLEELAAALAKSGSEAAVASA